MPFIGKAKRARLTAPIKSSVDSPLTHLSLHCQFTTLSRSFITQNLPGYEKSLPLQLTMPSFMITYVEEPPPTKAAQSAHRLAGPKLKRIQKVREDEWLKGYLQWDQVSGDAVASYWETRRTRSMRSKALREADEACKAAALQKPTWFGHWMTWLGEQLVTAGSAQREYTSCVEDLKNKHRNDQGLAESERARIEEGQIYSTDYFLTVKEMDRLKEVSKTSTTAETELLDRMRGSFIDRDHLRQMR